MNEAGRYDPLELLTLDEVGRLLKRSRDALLRDRKAGLLHVVRLGGSIRVPRVELERYVREAAERVDGSGQ